MSGADLQTPLTKDTKPLIQEGLDSLKPKNELVSCTSRLFADSFPNVIYMLAFFLVTAMNMLYVVKYAPEETAGDVIAGMGIAGTWLSISTYIVISSLNGGFSTLAAQAYGSRNYELVGLYFHKGLVLRLIGLIPSFIMLIFCDDILLLLGVSERSVVYAGIYARVCIPAIFVLAINDTIRAYIVAHNIFWPLLYMQIVFVIIHFVFCELFIAKLQLQMAGVGCAYFLTQVAGLAMYIFYFAKYQPTKETLFWPRKESFQHLLLQFKHEAWIALFMYLEWVGYEIVLILGGILGDLELRSLVVCYNIASFLYMPGSGLAQTLTTYIATTMGEGNINRVLKFIQAGAMIALLYIILISGILLILPEPLIRIYTNDEETVQLSVILLKIYGCFYMFDLSQIMEVAVLKGTGKEVTGTKYYVISILIVGPASSYILAFMFGLGAIGLYIGIAIGLVTMNALCFFVLKKIDLSQQIKQIKERILEQTKTDDDDRMIEMKEIDLS